MACSACAKACEKAKCELSSMMETEINLPFIAQDSSRSPVHLTQRITRSKFEQLVGDLLESSLQPCQAALTDAKLKAKDIDEVVLVGGSTRIPKVQQLVKEFFGREPNRSVNPDEVVAVGAAIQAAVLGGEMKEILLRRDALTLGIKVERPHGPSSSAIRPSPRSSPRISRPRRTTSPASRSRSTRASAPWRRTTGSSATST
jgi:molecular chaperone DnaK